MYAGQCLPRIVHAYPDAFELIQLHGKDVPYLKQIPDKLRHEIPPALLKIIEGRYDDVSELQRASTEAYLTLER